MIVTLCYETIHFFSHQFVESGNSGHYTLIVSFFHAPPVSPALPRQNPAFAIPKSGTGSTGITPPGCPWFFEEVWGIVVTMSQQFSLAQDMLSIYR